MARPLAAIDADLAAVASQIDALLARQADLQAERADAEAAAARAAAVRAPAPADGDWDAKTDFPWSPALETVREHTFRLPGWRRHQRGVCNAILSGRDVIALLPAGAGKSVCYQAPALVAPEGSVTLVLSPLVALIQDQVDSLHRLGIAADCITAATPPATASDIITRLGKGTLPSRLLYVTPERVARSRRFLAAFQKAARRDGVAAVCIDEAHTVSAWGNDFRVDMKKGCALVREVAPRVPILATTATATAEVLADVAATLGLRDAVTFRAPIDRPELFWEVVPKPDRDDAALDALAAWIKARAEPAHNGATTSGLVYALTRRECETVAEGLCARGLVAAAYHAELDDATRTARHAAWSAGTTPVLVATVAFGMGVSKLDARFVAHYAPPKSLSNLYQEGGRAGRDGQPARVALFWRLHDLLRQAAVVATDPGWSGRLRGVASYASGATCRRAALAAEFGDDAPPCARACDVCAADAGARFDGTAVAAAAARVLSVTAPAGAPPRATLAQLHTRWRSAAAGAADAALVKQTPKAVVEAVLTAAVAAGYLNIDVEYTAYAGNAYLTPAPRAALLADGRARLHVRLLTRDGAPAAAPKRRRDDEIVVVSDDE